MSQTRNTVYMTNIINKLSNKWRLLQVNQNFPMHKVPNRLSYCLISSLSFFRSQLIWICTACHFVQRGSTWLAENPKWVWHLNLFSMTRVKKGRLGIYSAILYKGDNFCAFLFAFLHTKSLLKRGLLWKEQICFKGEYLLKLHHRNILIWKSLYSEAMTALSGFTPCIKRNLWLATTADHIW